MRPTETLYQLPPNLPIPEDDGAADHLTGMRVLPVSLPATDGQDIDLSTLSGLTIVYAYPRTGQPGKEVPQAWDEIPGARGCTPQSCAFRDHHAELRSLGARVFGLSTQDSAYQREVVDRLRLPFPLLSDDRLAFTEALRLPTFEFEGSTLIKRLALIIENGSIAKVFYPVFPPDRNAEDVLRWLESRSELG